MDWRFWVGCLGVLAIVVAGCGDDSAPPGGMDGGGGACETAADCDDGVYCNGAEDCQSLGCIPGEPPCAGMCDEDGDMCVGACGTTGDADGDGVDSMECGGTDCDDADATRFPGNMEICDPDGRDEDCDDRTFGVRDADGDSSPDALCCNGSNCGDDCDDTRAAVNPRGTETCDMLDNDCDGSVDEGVLSTFYEDADGDDFGSADPGAMTMMGCVAPPGYADMATDCDDSAGGVNPGVPESCATAGVDDNCNGMADEMCDCTPPATRACMALGLCATGNETCVAGRWSACSIAPAPSDPCDGIDNDCDGSIDEGTATTCYADGDGDGYALMGAAVTTTCGACGMNETSRAPTGTNVDCRDMDANTYPGAPELCDGIDNDCSNPPPNAGGAVAAEDVDGDGYTATSYTGCMGGPFMRSDCNDRDMRINPGQTSYFGSGYCGPGTVNCVTCPAVPGRCYTSCSGCTTSPMTVPQSFDYNCNGTNDPQPASASCSGSGCISPCRGGNGPFTTQPRSNCGRAVSFRLCGGCPCTTSSGLRILGCR